MARGSDDNIRLAVIGLGERATTMIAALRRAHPRINLSAVANPESSGLDDRLRRAGLDDPPRLFPDADRLLEHADGFDALMIGTPCDLHAPLAIKVASTGLPLFLEKPIAILYEQLSALRDAYRGREGSVVVSFPLRLTPLFTAVMDVVRSGRLGTINQLQAINNVPYGGSYYANSFYREHSVTGGLWLQKATHDFDYINAALGRPVMVTAMASRKVYDGDKPQDLWCSACKLRETCPESPLGVARRGDDGGVGWDDHLCVFGNEIMHQDSGSALIMYEDGVHASYTQNMVSRRSAERRGAIITGYEASVDFDWYTGTARVVDHMDGRVDTITVPDAEEGHSGGDDALARNFVDLCLGRDESKCDLTDGLLSTSTCLAARASSHSQTWLPVGDVANSAFPPDAEAMIPTRADLEPVA